MTFKPNMKHSKPILRHNHLAWKHACIFRYYHLKNVCGQFDNFFVTRSQIHHHKTRNSSKIYKRYKKV